jgi:hypothetical protein
MCTFSCYCKPLIKFLFNLIFGTLTKRQSAVLIFSHIRRLKSRVLAACLFPCSDLPSTLKMEAVRFSETSIHIYQTTRSHIPHDGIARGNRREPLKSPKMEFSFRLVDSKPLDALYSVALFSRWAEDLKATAM